VARDPAVAARNRSRIVSEHVVSVLAAGVTSREELARTFG